MFQREKSKYFWWNPGVLTRENVDKTNPGLSSDEAEEVFEELRRRYLLESRIISDPKINGGEPFLIHKINEDKKMEWIDTINEDGFVSLWLNPWAKHLWGGKKTAIKGFIFAIILAFFIRLTETLADYIWRPPPLH